jgi:hypothetical protein
MTITWLTVESGKSGEKTKRSELRSQEVTYKQAVKETVGAIKTGYGVSYYQKNQITLLKYDKPRQCLLVITVRGTSREIIDLSDEEVIKKNI